MSELPEGEHVVSMVIHNNQLLVATNRYVYETIWMYGVITFKRIEFVLDNGRGEP